MPPPVVTLIPAFFSERWCVLVGSMMPTRPPAHGRTPRRPTAVGNRIASAGGQLQRRRRGDCNSGARASLSGGGSGAGGGQSLDGAAAVGGGGGLPPHSGCKGWRHRRWRGGRAAGDCGWRRRRSSTAQREAIASSDLQHRRRRCRRRPGSDLRHRPRRPGRVGVGGYGNGRRCFVVRGRGAAWSCRWRQRSRPRLVALLPCSLALATSVSALFACVGGDSVFDMLRSGAARCWLARNHIGTGHSRRRCCLARICF